MTEARISKNCGKLELLPDGQLCLVGWCVEGGDPDKFVVNIYDAVIAMLQEKRAEEISQPTPYFEVKL